MGLRVTFGSTTSPTTKKIFLFEIFFSTIIIDNNNYPIIFHLTLHELHSCKWCWQSVSQSIYIIISDYLILTSYAKVVQNRWRVGWVEISESLAAEVRCLLLHVAEWSLLIQTGSYVQKMVQPDWSNYPRHIQRDLDNSLLLRQFVLKARVWPCGSWTDLCTPLDFAQLYFWPFACFINLLMYFWNWSVKYLLPFIIIWDPTSK